MSNHRGEGRAFNLPHLLNAPSSSSNSASNRRRNGGSPSSSVGSRRSPARKRSRAPSPNNMNVKIRRLEMLLRHANQNINSIQREIARLKRLKFFGQKNNKK